MREPEIITGSDIVKLIAEIDEFKGRWEALKNMSPDQLSVLRRVATIESVGSSTRIEGAKLTNVQVESLLANIEMKLFTSRDEQEVAGYAEAMDLVYEAFDDLHLTENHIRQLHQQLLRHSQKDERHRGSYKTLSNNVVAFDSEGNELGVIFETSSAFDTPREMESLIAWTRKTIEEEVHHPLIIIAIFIVTFLAIHPFQDGNGRLSRVLTTLLLLRANYVYVPFASLERVIEENKDLYYRALRRTQATLKTDNPDWQPWLGFFLRCLKKQKDALNSRIEAKSALALADNEIPKLSRDILNLLSSGSQIGITEIEAATGANRNTLKLRLRELVKAGLITKHGKARATWYTNANS